MDHTPARPQYVKRNCRSHERVDNDVTSELHEAKADQDTDRCRHVAEQMSSISNQRGGAPPPTHYDQKRCPCGIDHSCKRIYRHALNWRVDAPLMKEGPSRSAI